MPNYSYICNSCNKIIAVNRPSEERDEPLEDVCPDCGWSDWARGIERKVTFVGEKGKGKW